MKKKKDKKSAKAGREKIIFTNGIFDILHKGHLDIFRFARSLGGKFIVGINSDKSARQLKGLGRPINNERYRKEFLETLGLADEVIIFDELNTSRIISRVKPDIVVKGDEFTEEEIRKMDKIPKHIQIVFHPLTVNPENSKKYSTTDIIKKIKSGEK